MRRTQTREVRVQAILLDGPEGSPATLTVRLVSKAYLLREVPPTGVSVSELGRPLRRQVYGVPTVEDGLEILLGVREEDDARGRLRVLVGPMAREHARMLGNRTRVVSAREIRHLVPRQMLPGGPYGRDVSVLSGPRGWELEDLARRGHESSRVVVVFLCGYTNVGDTVRLPGLLLDGAPLTLVSVPDLVSRLDWSKVSKRSVSTSDRILIDRWFAVRHPRRGAYLVEFERGLAVVHISPSGRVRVTFDWTEDV